MSPVVSFNKLSFTYPDGTIVLRDLSFLVEAGECLALLGANGAGKSTLLLHIIGILKGQGDCRIFGCIPEKQNLQQIRAKVGLLFQNPDDQLFLPTVRDNLAFVLENRGFSPDVSREKTRQILTRMGIPSLADRFAYHLSLGEKKKSRPGQRAGGRP